MVNVIGDDRFCISNKDCPSDQTCVPLQTGYDDNMSLGINTLSSKLTR